MGFWHKLISSNVFVLCTGIQFVRRGYGNRVIMRDNGSWASVPISFRFDPYNKILIADMSAVPQIGRRIKHWVEQKEYIYGKRLFPIIDRLIYNDENKLYKLNVDLINLILKSLKYDSTEVVIDEQLWDVKNRSQLITSVVLEYGEIYLSGSSVKNYLNRSDIKDIRNVFLQEIDPNLGSETVLHKIATEKNPLDYIKNSGSWYFWK